MIKKSELSSSYAIKVFIDDKPLKNKHATRGIGAYTRNLIEAIRKEKDVKLVEDKDKADIVHYPYFDLFFDTLFLEKGKPTVVTIYDVIPLIYPVQYKPGIKGKLKFLKQKARLKNIVAIITISETSKKDIVRLLGVPQERICPIHLAPASIFRKMGNGDWKIEIRKRYSLPGKFILYVGDVDYNKNVLNLIRAFDLITKKNKEIGLVIIGKAFEDDIPETREILQLIKELNLEKRVMIAGFVHDHDLAKIYNLATVYCQPSFYEGFGLPVLEAMACGIPVATSRTQALVEISEGAALFFNPSNPNAIASVLGNILNKTDLQKKLSKNGLLKVKNFSWDKTVGKTIDVYKKSLSY